MIRHKKRIPVLQIITIGLLPSFLKIIYYRLKGYQIGKKVHLGLGCIIDGVNVNIGEGTRIGYFTIIRAKIITIDRFVLIGSMSFLETETLEIGEDTRVREKVYIHGLVGPGSRFKIGKRSIIQMAFINPVMPIIIGDNVAIGGHALLFTHGSWLSELDGFPVNFAPITIGNNVYIAWRVTIVPGVNIGDNVVIGAHSLVNKNIPSNSMAAGCPARIIKENYPSQKPDEEKRKILEKIIVSFIDFVKYNGMKVEKKAVSNGLWYIIYRKNKKYKLIFTCDSEKHHHQVSDSVQIYFHCQADIKQNNNNKCMLIDIDNNLRFGKSKIGEEFVKYVSRYGLRFDRAD